MTTESQLSRGIWISIVVAIGLFGSYQLLIPGASARCFLQLRDSLIFEMPEPGLTLADFQEVIDYRTDSCGEVVVREGPTHPEAVVTTGGGRWELNTSSAAVLVETQKPEG